MQLLSGEDFQLWLINAWRCLTANTHEVSGSQDLRISYWPDALCVCL